MIAYNKFNIEAMEISYICGYIKESQFTRDWYNDNYHKFNEAKYCINRKGDIILLRTFRKINVNNVIKKDNNLHILLQIDNNDAIELMDRLTNKQIDVINKLRNGLSSSQTKLKEIFEVHPWM